MYDLKNIPTLTFVSATGNVTSIAFSSGVTLTLDWTAAIESDPALAPLGQDGVVESAELLDDGHTLGFLPFTHDDGDRDAKITIGRDTLWATYQAQQPMTGADLKAWRERHHLSLTQLAALLDRNRSTITRWQEAEAVPHVVKLACEHIDDSPAILGALVPSAKAGRRLRLSREFEAEEFSNF